MNLVHLEAEFPRPDRRRRSSGVLCSILAMVSNLLLAPTTGIASEQKPQIVDPAGDARPYAMQGPAAANIANADILEAWFSDTPARVVAHFRVAQAPKSGDGLAFRAYFHHDEQSQEQTRTRYGCLQLSGYYANAFLLSTGTETYGHLYDRCKQRLLGKTKVSARELTDGSAVVSVSAPRGSSSFLDSGASLTAPVAESYSFQQVPFNNSWMLLDRTDPGRGHRLGPVAVLPELTSSDCRRFSPAMPDSANSRRSLALKAPVADVTDEATEKDPLVFSFDKGPGGNFFVPYYAVHAGDNYDYFNLQVRSRQEEVGLHMRLEWSEPAADDFDLYLYAEDGQEVARSSGWNFAHQELEDASADVVYDDAGARSGPSYEHIHGFPSDECEGFTLEVDGHRTLGGQITLKVWLGKVDRS